jgi:hypothetical protein
MAQTRRKISAALFEKRVPLNPQHDLFINLSTKDCLGFDKFLGAPPLPGPLPHFMAERETEAAGSSVPFSYL